MFGAFRLYLAILVMAQHLLGVPDVGAYAVFSFFVLSGFLMTAIMHESYGYDWSGRWRYAQNRFLRLYPSYWIAIAISVAVIGFVGPRFAADYFQDLRLPATWLSTFENVTMVFANLFPVDVSPRLSPATWALTVEISYYVLIGLGVSRSKRLTTLWLLVSLAYVVVVFALRLHSGYRYFAIPAGSLPFSVGAALYFHKEALYRRIRTVAFLRVWPLALAHLTVCAGFSILACFGTHYAISDLGRYIGIAVTALLLVRLYYEGPPRLPRSVDNLLGRYSYPAYLLHFQLGALTSYLLFRRPVIGFSGSSLLVWIVNLGLIALVASAILFGVDPAIERLRTAIRARRRAPLSPTDLEPEPGAVNRALTSAP